VFQALGVGGGLEGQGELVPRRPRQRWGLLCPVAMVLQDVGGEVMLFEHSLNPAVINGIVKAVPDHPRQFASGKGMGNGQTDDALLNMPGQ
jgi:hypothetical protein